MKIFRNSILAAAALVLGLTSCNNDEVVDHGTKTVTIKIASAAAPKAIQAPGTATSVVLNANDGHIFLIAPDNSVINRVGLNTTQAGGTGQVLNSVSSSARVFIVANTASDAAANTALTTATTFAQIQAITTSVASYQAMSYTAVAVSNVSGAPVAISVTSPSTANVTVALSPVISRLELVDITGGIYGAGSANQTRITGFEVLGIALDAYSQNFTYTGTGLVGTTAPAQPLFEVNQVQLASWTGISDLQPSAGAWSATSTYPNPTDYPVFGLGSNVWAYNVAATVNAPRLVIAVANVTVDTSSDSGATWTASTTYASGTHYLTIGSYTGFSGNFVRGNIYSIPAGALVFNTSHLHSTPNPTDIDLTVQLTINDWVLNTLTPGLE
ncbi:MAG: hypothetical protein LBI15_11815 [Dysgonamonadaceae bacterium]|jgi:hypothetical protein|nr:hypothetical protein [Dysgonamonadaceae bacterium]